MLIACAHIIVNSGLSDNYNCSKEFEWSTAIHTAMLYGIPSELLFVILQRVFFFALP